MFSIDVTGRLDSDSESDCEIPKFTVPAFKRTPPEALTPVGGKPNNKGLKLSSSLDAGPEYNRCHYVKMVSDPDDIKNQVERHKNNMKHSLDEQMKKSVVCQPGFEKLEKVQPLLSGHQIKKASKIKREKTKGFQWHNMGAPELTEETKNDLTVLQMRQALDPKHFYKRSAASLKTPKYFQVGTVVDSPVDYYNSRVPKKQRKQTLVDELLEDAEFRKYQKKKAAEFSQNQPRRHVNAKKKAKKTTLRKAKANAQSKGKSKKKKS